MQDTAREAKTNSQVTFLYGPLHMDVPVLDDKPELIFITALQTLNGLN